MDIVVTYPKETLTNTHPPSVTYFIQNPENHSHHVFKLPGEPQDVEQDDRCFIGFDNRIHGYFYIDEIKSLASEEAAEVCNYARGAGWAVISAWDFHELPDPKPTYGRGTPGFWYLDTAKKNGLVQGNIPDYEAPDEEDEDDGPQEDRR